MIIDKAKLKGLLWAETASWSADCSEWKRTTEALDEFLGEKTIEEVALALLEENERLTENASSRAIRSLRGDCADLLAERDQLKAESEALCREREGKVLCELELFETLRDSANTEADEHRQCMATYRPLRQANLDSVVKKCDELLAANQGVEPYLDTLGKGDQP